MNTLKLASFNLRCDLATGDGANCFPYRKDYLCARIAAERPDAIGFQEIRQTMIDAMRPALPGYVFYGCGRETDYGGEKSAIAIREDAFELHALDNFWLSPTPQQPGSRFEEQSDCPRLCVATRLLHKPTGSVILLYNTHLDHISEQAQILGLRAIFERMAADRAKWDVPAFLTGDFNAQPGGALCAMFAAYGYADLTASLGGTFHDYGRRTPIKIDYILADEASARHAYTACTWHEEHDGVYLSDHDGVCVKWSLRA